MPSRKRLGTKKRGGKRREKKYSRRRYKSKGGDISYKLSQILTRLDFFLSQFLYVGNERSREEHDKRIHDIYNNHTWLLEAQGISRSVSSLDSTLKKYNENDDLFRVIELSLDNIGTLIEKKEQVPGGFRETLGLGRKISSVRQQYNKVKILHNQVSHYL
jgi:hypothetical protein